MNMTNKEIVVRLLSPDTRIPAPAPYLEQIGLGYADPLDSKSRQAGRPVPRIAYAYAYVHQMFSYHYPQEL
jgi:hypothetical protein